MPLLHDTPSTTDLIGYSDIQVTLVSLIKALPINEGSSFSIGVYGEWGTGKTSMLEQIRSSFLTIDNTSTVWFNPWQFSGDDNIVYAFFQVLASQISKNIKKKDTSNITKISNGLRSVATAIRTQTKTVGVPGIWTVDIQGYKNKQQFPGTEQIINDLIEKLGDNSDVYFDMLNILNKLFDEFDERIIVFVDDLDRCAPRQAIKFLEGIKILFNIPNFVFVMGMASSRIEKAIELHFHNEFAEIGTHAQAKYLDKIIQFSFKLPPPDPLKLKQNILKPELQDIPNFDQYADLILDSLGTNPRTIKRLLNTIAFQAALSTARNNDNPQDGGLVIKLALLSYLMPRLNNVLEKHPRDLIRLGKNAMQCLHGETDDILEAITKGITPGVKNEIRNQEAVILFKILTCGGVSSQFFEQNLTYNFVHIPSDSKHPFQYDSDIVNPEREQNSNTYADITNRMVLIDNGEPFYIDPYLVTQDLYFEVTHKYPSLFSGKNHPVENVSWVDAVTFCNLFSKIIGLDAAYTIEEDRYRTIKVNKANNGFRLPTEKEWMAACGEEYSNFLDINKVGWYFSNSNASTSAVGQLQPNQFGLYDLLGNVWEWCEDVSSESDIKHCCKGGAWSNFESSLNRRKQLFKNIDFRDSNIGFRIVRNARKTNTTESKRQ